MTPGTARCLGKGNGLTRMPGATPFKPAITIHSPLPPRSDRRSRIPLKRHPTRRQRNWHGSHRGLSGLQPSDVAVVAAGLSLTDSWPLEEQFSRWGTQLLHLGSQHPYSRWPALLQRRSIRLARRREYRRSSGLRRPRCPHFHKSGLDGADRSELVGNQRPNRNVATALVGHIPFELIRRYGSISPSLTRAGCIRFPVGVPAFASPRGLDQWNFKVAHLMVDVV